MDYQLHQRGRASIDFLIDLRVQSNVLEPQVEAAISETIANTNVDPATLSDTATVDHLQQRVLPVAQTVPEFRLLRLLREWMLDVHGHIAMDAFEQIRDEVTPTLDELTISDNNLNTIPDEQLPAYWDGYEFHRSAGGWDGHDYMGFVHGELIHYHMVGRSLAGVLHMQRVAAAQEADVAKPRSILEMGCASGQFTQALAEAYPEAFITALDLSVRQLEQTQRRANQQGYSWQLLQAAAESTGLESGNYDLVCSYAMFHELPADVAQQVMQEKFRLCKPGGRILMADVKSYRSLTDQQLWSADFWNQVVGGDPYWREYALTDFAELASAVGFENVSWQGLGEMGYPYVLTATKPE